MFIVCEKFSSTYVSVYQKVQKNGLFMLVFTSAGVMI